jgi:hypothetical protein
MIRLKRVRRKRIIVVGECVESPYWGRYVTGVSVPMNL